MQDIAFTPDRLFSIGTGYRRAKALLSAIELGLFTVLAGQPVVAADLERMLGIHTRAARDFFDALVALGLLQRGDDGRSALGRRAAALTVSVVESGALVSRLITNHFPFAFG